MRIKVLFFSLFFALVINVNAQEQLGIRLDNYSGINGIFFNPASTMTTPFQWDINLVEGTFFEENNYMFFPDKTLSDFRDIDNAEELIVVGDKPGEVPVSDKIWLVDFYSDNKKRYAGINQSITGPSFFARIDEFNSIGLTFRQRILGSGRNIPVDLSYYIYDRKPNFEPFAADKFQMGLLSLGEIGVNYTHTIPLSQGDLGIGATLKYLRGYQGAYFSNEDVLTLTKMPGDSLHGANVNLNYGFTSPLIQGETDEFFKATGSGAAIDLGIVYTFAPNADGYMWKLGVALLDVGKIKFDKLAEMHEVLTDEAAIVTVDYKDTLDMSIIADKLTLFSYQTLNDSTASFSDNKFSMWLPTALSLSFDYSFSKDIYLNVSAIQGIPVSKRAVHRGSLLALTPRYESRWISAAAPVSLYNYNDLHFGLAVRLAFLTIGSDDIGSLIGPSDFTGTDFYVALKLNPFQIGSGNGWGKGRGKRGKEPGCYQF